jgi:hypothetical protein
MAVAAARLVYGGAAYGTLPYGGYIPANIIPTRNVSGITFLTSNDRYQVVACSYGGSLSTPPEFRYWYAGPAPWAESLGDDDYIPPFYSEDEDGLLPVGSLELPFRKFSQGQEGEITGVTVEFVPRPSSITHDTVTSGQDVTFTVTVEAQGVRGYTSGTGITTTGMTSSESFSFAEDAAEQGSTMWPNLRTVFYPTRVQTRCRSARVVVTDVRLCEIVSVSLTGKTLSGRDR